MRASIAATLSLALCFLPANSIADSADPPARIEQTTMTLSRLDALHKRAVGELVTPLHTIQETWTYSHGDLNGTETNVSSGDDYREDTVLGPFHSARGRYRGQTWAQNENGLTLLGTGVHRRDEIDARVLRNGLSAASGVTLLGQVTYGAPAFVVKVAPAGGRIEYQFFDEISYLIVRRERAVEDQRVVTTYDDFRATDGATRAWHIHESDGRPYNESDWRLQALAYGKPIDAAKLQIPPSDTSHFKLGAPKVVLPAKIIEDRVILATQIGGRKVDFLLDSGASGILLNKAVADALKMPSYGRQTETTAGTYTSTRSVVPRIDIGGATLENIALITAPFHEWADQTTPVAGLLGFDFIANCVVHIDYAGGTVEAIDPASFGAPAGAIAVPIRLDDGVPILPVRIASTIAERFILDTGADRSVLFSGFVAAHPGDTQDQGLGEQFTETYPFMDRMGGVGGTIKTTHTQVSSLGIGSTTFPRWLFSVVHDAPSFEGEDYDGLVGQDVLRYFDVYFDYPALKVYLVPNERYRQRWGG